jgi:glycosyltransferase involved in cell wall biosynthesis
MSQASGVPAASVIMPVYNAGRFLDKAIESVLGQSFPDFELLLLNDGSQDGSLDRLHHFAARDARCKVHSWANRGLIKTLNEGVRLAKADILIRMDGDDICRTQRFEHQISYLAAHPECVAVGSRVMLIDPDGHTIRPFAEQVEHAAIDAQHLAGNGGAIAHPAVALRKAAVVGVGGYRTEFRTPRISICFSGLPNRAVWPIFRKCCSTTDSISTASANATRRINANRACARYPKPGNDAAWTLRRAAPAT